MNTGTYRQGSRTMRVVKGLLLQVTTTALVAACGGGGGYGGGGGSGSTPTPTPPPAAVLRDAQFTDDTVDGLIFSVAGVGEGRTDSTGKFQFADGKKIDFLIGSAANRIAIGSATPGYTSGVVAFGLHDLTEAQGATAKKPAPTEPGEAEEEEVEIDQNLDDDDTFIEEQEEEDADVTDIIGGDRENEEEG